MWSGIRESNPVPLLGRQVPNHSVNATINRQQRQDSNLKYVSQSHVCCQLHHAAIIGVPRGIRTLSEQGLNLVCMPIPPPARYFGCYSWLRTRIFPVNSWVLYPLSYVAINWCREPELNRDLLGFNQALLPFELSLHIIWESSRINLARRVGFEPTSFGFGGQRFPVKLST